MTTVSENDNDSQNPLLTYTPPACPQCGSSLVGLPPESTCPKCGLSYGPNHIIFFAGLGRRLRIIRAKRLEIIIRMILILLPFELNIIFMLTSPVYLQHWLLEFHEHPIFSILLNFFPFIYIPVSLLLLRRYLRKMPAPIQVRLTPTTYALKLGHGPVKPKPWLPTSRFTLHTKPNTPPQIRVSRRFFWLPDFYLAPITPPELTSQIVSQANTWIAAQKK